MDDCNSGADMSIFDQSLCSDSSMDDCNRSAKLPKDVSVSSSDSSMDDCNMFYARYRKG